jgi:type III restriction enzyme
MELLLQKELEHQKKSVEAISDVFKDVNIISPEQYYKNPKIDLNDYNIKSNILSVQKRLEVKQIYTPANDNCLHLDIKMETGTGKTYVYTHTIYELHKKYGINKFIIFVPSLAIKAGTKQFILDPYTQKHFYDTCNYDTNINLGVVRPKKPKKGRKYFPSEVREFVDGSCQNKKRIYVLLINMQLITGKTTLLTENYDSVVQDFYNPIEAIRATRPFVIIDEPHRFKSEQQAYRTIIDKIQPQCLIRFGATFPERTIGSRNNRRTEPDYTNLLYDLNACKAFNQNLVKGIAKEHIEFDGQEEKVRLTDINGNIATFRLINGNPNNPSHMLSVGDSLGMISNKLEGLTIDEIKSKVVLSNGKEINKNEEIFIDQCAKSYQEEMLKLAIRRHFETEKENFNRKNRIKTLALFFIDNIESFRGDENGNSAWLRDSFDRLLREQIEDELNGNISDEYKEYLIATKNDIAQSRAGYFAQDNKDASVEQEVDDILHNKKKLLSFKSENGSWNTRRFLFSKWTLKEGWDNPNVFTIAKLRSSGSEISKLQEVGRGLRLPVDEYGNRISSEEFTLNYIVDFTEKDFANKLVAEINGQATNQVIQITEDELQRVANIRNITTNELFIQLLTANYVDINRNVIIERINDFYNDYPEFNDSGVISTKIIDRNGENRNVIGIRQENFNKIQELWRKINKKYIIIFNEQIDNSIQERLPELLNNSMAITQEVRAVRQRINTGENQDVLEVGNNEVTANIINSRKLDYNDFLIRINRATHIPISVINNGIRQSNISSQHINEATLKNFINKFSEWKINNLQGMFNYKQTNYNEEKTALTNIDGTIRNDVVQGNIGTHLEAGNPPKKYLYDRIAYDSNLEKENIITDIDKVTVYGKIPRKSLAIPTIADSTYSPDFMYLVEKKNGEKELNLVVETKDVPNINTLREEEQIKINCAKEFFKQLQDDNIKVHFETQLNDRTMLQIIEGLMNADNN